MRFDIIIIGGGLSGLVCGIQLAKSGKSVAIIAAGQSSMHFSSGSFDLLGYDTQGQIVDTPLNAISQLPPNHPYQKIGSERVAVLADQAQKLFRECGIALQGDANRNHFRVTPMGVLKPTWLTLQDYATSPHKGSFPYRKVLLCNVTGYLDCPVEFISEGLRKLGTEVRSIEITIPALKARRHSPSEMRSANIAKVLSIDETLTQVADEINNRVQEEEIVLMPAIIGLENPQTAESLQKKVHTPIHYIPTLPPSVPGVRMQNQLKKTFTRLGGIYLLGNRVLGGLITNGQLQYINTTSLADEKLYADKFILATGSFQSDGIKSNFEKVYEPVFDLDVDALTDRTQWTVEDVFQPQPYMSFGVSTTREFQCIKHGQVIKNLHAIGSVLSGHNSIHQADGTGVSILTALAVAQNLINQ